MDEEKIKKMQEDYKERKSQINPACKKHKF